MEKVWRAGKTRNYLWSMSKLQKHICDTGIWCVCLFLAGIFVASSLHKFQDPLAFAGLISKNVELPQGVVGFMAIWLPCFELSLAIALLIPKAQRAALVLAVAVLVFFTAIISLNLLKGLKVPCGCFSNQNEPATWWNVARNLLFISLAMFAAFLKQKRVQKR